MSDAVTDQDPSEAPSCPLCAGLLARIPRLSQDRAQSAALRLRRFRCTGEGCGWVGLLALAPRQAPAAAATAATSTATSTATARPAQPSAAPSAPQPPQTPPARRPARPLAVRLVRASLLGLAVAGAVGVPIAVIALVGLGALAGPRAGLLLAAGQSHDGLGLRGGQLLQVQAAGAAAAAPGDGAATSAEMPATLTIRHGCAWGQPGRNPYRGSTAQALRAARLPAEVVQQIVALRQGGQKAGRLTISTSAIRSDDGGREFDPTALAMSFGQTLCLHSRVNFAPGHTEPADLYEAKDSQGRLYSVMVPDVCGNVTVLGTRNKRGVVAGMAGVLAQRSVEVAALAEVLADGPDGAPADLAVPGADAAPRPSAKSSGKVDEEPAQQPTAETPVPPLSGPLRQPQAGNAVPAPADYGNAVPGSDATGSTSAQRGMAAVALAGVADLLLPRSVVVPALQVLAGTLAQSSESLAGLAGALGDHEASQAVQVLRQEGDPQTVPEPGTWALVLAALAALGASAKARWRRR